jgi:hypothetical protein
MNQLRVLLVAVALLTAACGAATISSSPVKSVSNAGNVRVDAGANAATDVAASAEDSFMGRVNPTVRQGATAPVQPSLHPATNATQPSASGHDRCTNGIGANAGFTPMTGKQPPQPECAVE